MEILKSLEDERYPTITEVEFEDDAWQIEVYRPGDKGMDLKVDPVNGESKGHGLVMRKKI